MTKTTLPGPTGESNVLTKMARGPILCLGPGEKSAAAQAKAVEALGGRAIVAKGDIDSAWLFDLPTDALLWWGDGETARTLRAALARRAGPILPLITGMPDTGHVCHERHVCVDTTASGGNAQLLSGAA